VVKNYTPAARHGTAIIKLCAGAAFTILYQAFSPYLPPAMHPVNRYIICCLLLLCCLHLQAQNFGPFNTPILKPTDNPATKLGSAIFYKITTSKSTLFAGEAVQVQYKLYFAVLAQPSPGKTPAFTGCSVIELASQQAPITEVVNGKTYNVIIARNVQLTPLQDGPLLLPEASVNNVIQYVTADNPGQLKEFSMAATCAPVTLTVKPLPEQNKPVDFTGLVGNFTISARVDTNTVPINDNTHFTLIIKGMGNINAINLPGINWPANTEHFDANDTQHTHTDTFPVSGDKIFSIPFLGTKQGTAVIPPVSFSYFDPAGEKYVTVQSDSIRLNFTGPLPKTQQPEIVTEDITNRKYLWIVPAIALTVGFILIITGKRQQKEKKRLAEEKEKERLWQEAIKQAETVKPPPPINFNAALQSLALVEDDRAFFNMAKEVLTKAIQQKTSAATAQEGELLHLLYQYGADAVIIEDARHIYKVCNLCLYAPVVEEGQRVLVHETLAVVVDKLTRPHPASPLEKGPYENGAENKANVLFE